jgi:competence protein ComEC
MIIAPAIQARFFRRTPKFLTIVILESLSAELMTLPLIMLTFSQLSLVALLANMLIVPLVPAGMLLAALAATAGALLPALAGWIALPARLVLTFMLDVVHMLASIPSVLVHASINVGYMLSFYALLLVVIVVLHHRARINSLKMVK